MAKECDCMYQIGTHNEGSGRCPYGPRATMPHPDGVRRASARANAYLSAIVAAAEQIGTDYPTLYEVFRASDPAVLRRVPLEEIRPFVTAMVTGEIIG